MAGRLAHDQGGEQPRRADAENQRHVPQTLAEL
jgi:hypothetical protein